MNGKQLVVNADDFGFTRDVNEGTVEAHEHGILTATTLMANGDAFDHALELAQRHPTLDIGCHLVLIQGRSLLPGSRPLPKSHQELIQWLASGRIDVYAELAAQMRHIVDAGIRPTHLDTHKHTHLLPPVLRAVARLSRDFGIPWVRRPFDFRMAEIGGVPLGTRAANFAMRLTRPYAANLLRSYGCRFTDYFAGFQMTGRFQTEQLVSLIRQLPEGLTEFMCHPGRLGAELQGAATRLKESRVLELEALIAPETRQALVASGAKLVSYRSA